jgi:hypothetical protein
MRNIFIPPQIKTNQYGKLNILIKDTSEFNYLIGINVNDIITFDNGSEELYLSGATILPRHYFIFVGTKDDEIRFKPYEFNRYRIVVATHKDIVMNIESIG